MNPFPVELFSWGPFRVTDTIPTSLAVSLVLLLAGLWVVRSARLRAGAEVAYDYLESAVRDLSPRELGPLVPLVLTQWLFIGAANVAGVLPRVDSPTRDLALAAALAVISLVAGHVWALRTQGLRYLRSYIEPNPLLLPFNLIGEVSRTIALALRLFGNMLSGTLIAAIVLYVAGLLLPIPLMLLGLLTSLVQAYIFGVLTLVFAVSSLSTATRTRKSGPPTSGGAP